MKSPLDCKIAFASALLLGAAVANGPALADEPAQDQQQQATQMADQSSSNREPTVLICKVFAVTGSRIEHEYCLTQDDWDDIREDSRRALERLMRTGAEA